VIQSGLRSASEAPSPPNIMIMYFIGVSFRHAPVVGAGSRSEQTTRIPTSQHNNLVAVATRGYDRPERRGSLSPAVKE
jgi:hypothetical protein